MVFCSVFEIVLFQFKPLQDMLISDPMSVCKLDSIEQYMTTPEGSPVTADWLKEAICGATNITVLGQEAEKFSQLVQVPFAPLVRY